MTRQGRPWIATGIVRTSWSLARNPIIACRESEHAGKTSSRATYSRLHATFGLLTVFRLFRCACQQPISSSADGQPYSYSYAYLSPRPLNLVRCFRCFPSNALQPEYQSCTVGTHPRHIQATTNPPNSPNGVCRQRRIHINLPAMILRLRPRRGLLPLHPDKPPCRLLRIIRLVTRLSPVQRRLFPSAPQAPTERSIHQHGERSITVITMRLRPRFL